MKELDADAILARDPAGHDPSDYYFIARRTPEAGEIVALLGPLTGAETGPLAAAELVIWRGASGEGEAATVTYRPILFSDADAEGETPWTLGEVCTRPRSEVKIVGVIRGRMLLVRSEEGAPQGMDLPLDLPEGREGGRGR